jgi:Sec-independent protein secretion pathway component TatC
MAIVFIPLYLLYEAGILVARIFARNPVESPASS